MTPAINLPEPSLSMPPTNMTLAISQPEPPTNITPAINQPVPPASMTLAISQPEPLTPVPQPS